MAPGGVALAPAGDVESRGGAWVATGPEPWLRCAAPACGGRWLRVAYSSGLLDPLRRPILRFVGASGFVDEILPAAMFGRAFWVVRAPDDAREVWISPTIADGPFAFRLDELTLLSAPAALGLIGRASLTKAGRYVWGAARGWDRWARLQARRALGAAPLSDYEAWRDARMRGFEPGFDDYPGASALGFLLRVPDAASARALTATLGAAAAPRHRVAIATERAGDDEIVIDLAAGDRLAPHALAAVAEAFARDPKLDAAYADEDCLGPSGRGRSAPRLKPDFSPIFAASGYFGAPLAVRGAFANSPGADVTSARVAHVRRVLASRAAPSALAVAPESPATPSRLAATLLVPTRDRLDLLRACVESLERHPAGADFELLALDNGSQGADTLAYLEALGGRPERRVLRLPGPFNFSAICNAGAAEARAPFLVFLNDDVEALSPGWLGHLLACASRPEVGAVGAKLLYPDGRLQHGGVVLGLDGLAGHMQRLVSADDPGYLGALVWPREVSAVTGACLAVEARKFHAVGGFDAERLPIEYNDIDLCLRLGERGYKTVYEPRARLMHRESASRGANPRLDSRYDGEHKHFRARWARRLRDDPYFHPALSLDALDIALG